MAAVASDRLPFLQPFQCHICHGRFTRHENLKRHAALHNRTHNDASLSCELCNATFSRPDLRHRHMKKKHADHEEARPRKRRRTPPKAPSDSGSPQDETRSGVTGQSGSSNGDDSHPPADPLTHQMFAASLGQVTDAPIDLGLDMVMGNPQLGPSGEFGLSMPVATPQSLGFHNRLPSFSFDQGILDDCSLPSLDLSPGQDDWYPSMLQVARGCDLFFDHVSPFVPIIHRPTFDSTQEPSHLTLGMLCLAYQYGEDPDNEQPGSGGDLSIRCFHHARGLLSNEEEEDGQPSTYHVAKVQAYLFLQIYAMMYLCGRKYSAFGLKTHSKMVSLARAGGLMQQSTSAETGDLASLWQEFIRFESQKRTIFAIHQIDTLWYQFLSTPRLLSHLEIKHELPCPEDYWTASSSIDWAHRQLVARRGGSLVQYPDAIRRFLSTDVDIDSIPPFDPYGAINVTHFLVSSAREISGWSTMTGMLSLERLEPIRSSLLALGPFVRPARHPDAPRTNLCEATWETAMIEMQLWSPSHTGGVVEGSMDAVVQQFTDLPSKCGFLCEPGTATIIQPHVNWFLCYLDAELVPDSEAPWMMLYAFKAFMIAWQFVSGGVADAMQVVGVSDGDTEEALAWAKKVFQRRQRWQLGQIIMACLDTLRN